MRVILKHQAGSNISRNTNEKRLYKLVQYKTHHLKHWT